MVYKRYIKRGEKLCGPYYYESYRDKNGKVKTRFLSGPTKKDNFVSKLKNNLKKVISKKFLFVFSLIFGILILALIFGNLNYNNFTGRVVEDAETNGLSGVNNADLTITEPGFFSQVFLGRRNQVMEFELPNQTLQLTFDLLNYNFFIEKNRLLRMDAEGLKIGVEEYEDYYKWGYGVQLNDLEFMAKIDLVANDKLEVLNNYTFKLGENVLSFSDLVQQGYTVTSTVPAILEEKNQSVCGDGICNSDECYGEFLCLEDCNPNFDYFSSNDYSAGVCCGDYICVEDLDENFETCGIDCTEMLVKEEGIVEEEDLESWLNLTDLNITGQNLTGQNITEKNITEVIKSQFENTWNFKYGVELITNGNFNSYIADGSTGWIARGNWKYNSNLKKMDYLFGSSGDFASSLIALKSRSYLTLVPENFYKVRFKVGTRYGYPFSSGGAFVKIGGKFIPIISSGNYEYFLKASSSTPGLEFVVPKDAKAYFNIDDVSVMVGYNQCGEIPEEYCSQFGDCVLIDEKCYKKGEEPIEPPEGTNDYPNPSKGSNNYHPSGGSSSGGTTPSVPAGTNNYLTGESIWRFNFIRGFMVESFQTFLNLITGPIVNAASFTGNAVFGEEKYTLSVYVEKNFTNSNYSIGDTINLDPIFTIFAEEDTTAPLIEFNDGTDENGLVKGGDNIFVSVSASDAGRGDNNISMFIDFNDSLVGWWRMDDVNMSTQNLSSTPYYILVSGAGSGEANGIYVYLGDNGDYEYWVKYTDDGRYFIQNEGQWAIYKENFEDDLYVNLGGSSLPPKTGWEIAGNDYAASPSPVLAYFTGPIVPDYIGNNDALVSEGTAQLDSGYFGLGLNLENDYDYGGAFVPQDPITASIWYKGSEDSSWTFVVNSSGTTYVNGVPGIPDEFPLYITGGLVEFGGTGSGDYFNGSIDEAMVFNRELSAEEVAGLYADNDEKSLAINFGGLEYGYYPFKAYAQDTSGNVEFTDQWEVGLDSSNVSDCRELNTANTKYILINDLVSNVGVCLEITADNITVDGNGFSISGSDSEYYGVYASYVNNITLKNFKNISGFGNASFKFGDGIAFNYVNNSLIENLTLEGNGYVGVGLFRSLNNTSKDIVANSNYYGIYLSESDNQNLTNVVANSNRYGIMLAYASDNVLSNITANSNKNGVYLDIYSDNNSFTNLNLWNCSSGISTYCVYSYSSRENTYENVYLNYSNLNGGGIYLYDTSSAYGVNNYSNNLFKNLVIENMAGKDILLKNSYLNYASLNNTFLNATYDLFKESVEAHQELIRKWYYRAHTLDTSGTDVGNAIVNVYSGLEGIPYLNLTTNESGWTNESEIIEYVDNGGVRTIYDNSVIASNYNMTLWDDHIYNVTDNKNNLNDSFILDVDVTPPVLSSSAWSASPTTTTIIWNTDDPSNSSVYAWGSSASGGNNIPTIHHQVVLTGLISNHTYEFNYTSCDFAGNCNTTYGGTFMTAVPGAVINSGGALSCVPNWKCDVCVGESVGGSGTQTCIDLNKCAGDTTKSQSCIVQESYFNTNTAENNLITDLETPIKGASGCVSNLECSDWSICQASYNLQDIIEEKVLLKGEQERECVDLNNCLFDRTERQECNPQIAIYAKKVFRCGEEYIEIYDEQDILISRMKLSNGVYQKLDVQMLFDRFGYCPYCYNDVQDYNEDEIDCQYSGEDCPVCAVEAFSLKKSYPLILVGLIGLVALTFFVLVWYLHLRRREHKRRKKIIKLSLLKQGEDLGRDFLLELIPHHHKKLIKLYKRKHKKLIRAKKKIIKKQKKYAKKQRKAQLSFEERASLARDISIFEKGVQRLKELRKEIDNLKGYEKEKQAMREDLNEVSKIPSIERKIRKLKNK